MTQAATSNIVGTPVIWMTVKDLQSALDFYTNIIGYELVNKYWEFRWAELKGPDGRLIGLSQEGPLNPHTAGTKTIVLIEVLDINEAYNTLKNREDVTILGEITRYRGHGLMLNFLDADGNQMQFFQKDD